MTSAERALLAKARRGEPLTVDDRLSVIDSVGDVDWFKAGLQIQRLDTPEALGAVARRKAEIQKARITP